MQAYINEPKVMRLLLVSELDHVTPANDVEPVISYIDQDGWHPYEGTVINDGNGWYRYTLPGISAPGVVVVTARAEGTAEWRDIIEVIEPGPSMADFARLEQKLDTLIGLSYHGLSGLNVETLPGDLSLATLTQAHKLIGNVIEMHPALVTTGTLAGLTEALKGLGIIVGAPDVSVGRVGGLILGDELLPGSWRVHDDTGAGQSGTDDGIFWAKFGEGGSNQQAYQVLPSLEPGQYLFEVKLTMPQLDEGEMRVHLHRSPYTNLTTPWVIVPTHGEWAIADRVMINGSAGEQVRLQFQFARRHNGGRINFPVVSIKRVV